ncbi:MAG: site-specific integrase, partial [Methanobacteriota archaeon]
PERSLDALQNGKWTLEVPLWDIVAKAAIMLYSHSGLRPTELRLAKLDDLDLANMTIRVSSPKGKGRWADGNEIAPLMPGCELAIAEYLRERNELLSRCGCPNHESLFPFVALNGRVGYWSQAMWGKLKQQVEMSSGVGFRWKDFRPTLAQHLLDSGVTIEVASKVLRHTSTRTTELYYARIRPESAFSKARQAWQSWKPSAAAIPILAD